MELLTFNEILSETFESRPKNLIQNTKVKSITIPTFEMLLENISKYPGTIQTTDRSVPEIIPKSLYQDLDTSKLTLNVGKSVHLLDVLSQQGVTGKIKVEKEKQTEFCQKLIWICLDLGFNPNWILPVMYLESGFDSYIKNKKTSARGLIQFMDKTSRLFGLTTSDDIPKDPIRQLDYVYRYFQIHLRNGKKIKSPVDCYLIVFQPAHVGKDYKTVKVSEIAYKANKGLFSKNVFRDDSKYYKTLYHLEQTLLRRSDFAYAINNPYDSNNLTDLKIQKPDKTNVPDNTSVKVEQPIIKVTDVSTVLSQINVKPEKIKEFGVAILKDLNPNKFVYA